VVTRPITIVLGFLLAGSSWCMAADIEKPKTLPIGGKIRWVFDYEEAKALSRMTGKPMFVVFRCER
jgi:hypothetical protein